MRRLQTTVLAALVITIPLHMVQGTGGEPRLGIDLTVGRDAVRVLLDSGSAGLRLLVSALHGDSATRTGKRAAGGYGSGLRFEAVQG